MTEQNECIFCKIAQGEIPPLGDGTFWEDDNFMAFLSPFPNTEGFSIVITKEHYDSDVLQMSDDKLSEFVLAAKAVAKKLTDYFDDVGRTGLIMEGTGVNHAHIKLFPMHETQALKKGGWKEFPSSGDKRFFETYEGYLTSNNGPRADDDELRALAEKLK